jgi:hypothetical protein
MSRAQLYLRRYFPPPPVLHEEDVFRFTSYEKQGQVFVSFQMIIPDDPLFGKADIWMLFVDCRAPRITSRWCILPNQSLRLQ